MTTRRHRRGTGPPAWALLAWAGPSHATLGGRHRLPAGPPVDPRTGRVRARSHTSLGIGVTAVTLFGSALVTAAGLTGSSSLEAADTPGPTAAEQDAPDGGRAITRGSAVPYPSGRSPLLVDRVLVAQRSGFAPDTNETPNSTDSDRQGASRGARASSSTIPLDRDARPPRTDTSRVHRQQAGNGRPDTPPATQQDQQQRFQLLPGIQQAAPDDRPPPGEHGNDQDGSGVVHRVIAPMTTTVSETAEPVIDLVDAASSALSAVVG